MPLPWVVQQFGSSREVSLALAVEGLVCEELEKKIIRVFIVFLVGQSRRVGNLRTGGPNQTLPAGGIGNGEGVWIVPPGVCRFVRLWDGGVNIDEAFGGGGGAGGPIPGGGGGGGGPIPGGGGGGGTPLPGSGGGTGAPMLGGGGGGGGIDDS